jgi:hypothetical protein
MVSVKLALLESQSEINRAEILRVQEACRLLDEISSDPVIVEGGKQLLAYLRALEQATRNKIRLHITREIIRVLKQKPVSPEQSRALKMLAARKEKLLSLIGDWNKREHPKWRKILAGSLNGIALEYLSTEPGGEPAIHDEAGKDEQPAVNPGSSSLLDIDSQRLPDLKDASSRRASVDRYIADVLAQTGKRITRIDIWKKAGYADATEFERWQRGDQKQSKAAGENLRRILTDKPHLK